MTLINELEKFGPNNLESTIETMNKWIDDAVENNEEGWFDKLGDSIKHVTGFQRDSYKFTGALLSKAKKLWKDKKVSLDIRMKYDNDFMQWAKEKVIEDPSRGDSTVRNYISVYEYFVKNVNKPEGFCLPPRVHIFDEDTNKEIAIVPNLSHASESKLLIVKGLAKQRGGNLEDVTIAALCDPSVTSEQFKSYVSVERKKHPSLDKIIESESHKTHNFPKTDIKYKQAEVDDSIFCEDGAWFYTKDKVTVTLFQGVNEDKLSPLWLEGYNHMLSRFGLDTVTTPPVYFDAKLQTPVVFPADIKEGETPSIIFNPDGYNLYDFSVDEARNLVNLLNKAILQFEA